MYTERSRRGSRGVGLLIVVIGTLFLLDQLHILHFGSIIGTWWPLILVLIGAVKLNGGERTSGLVLLVVGSVFMLANLDLIDWGDIFRFWPVLLILIGFSMMFDYRPRFGMSGRDITEDDFSIKVFFGGAERRITSQQLRGGEVMALFGGVELDLRDAKPAADCDIRITTIFGGAEVRIPPDWQIIIAGTPILGGIEDKTRQEGNGPVVSIHCSAVFGGIELRN